MAEAVVGQCAGVTVVDLADRVLPSVLDTESAEIIEAHLTSQGMVLKLETSITEIGDMESMCFISNISTKIYS